MQLNCKQTKIITIKTFKTPISHAMGLPENKIILGNTHFRCNGPARKQNYHYKTPNFTCNGPAGK